MIKITGLVVVAPGIVSAKFFLDDQQLADYQFEVERAAVAPQVQVSAG